MVTRSVGLTLYHVHRQPTIQASRGTPHAVHGGMEELPPSNALNV
jgi:hypothetical protein